MKEAEHVIILPLEGVDNEHCATIVKKGLVNIPGVHNPRIEINNNRAIIEADEPQTVSSAVTTIRDLGYDVATIKKTFPVLHMSCASCAVSAQTVLENLPGVVSASVNYANASVLLEYLPSLSPGSMKSALQGIGYDLLIDEDKQQDELKLVQQQHHRKLQRHTWGAIILAVPLVIIGMFGMDLPYANYIMWALTTPVLFVFGWRFFRGAWKQAKHRSANMDTLVALSTGVAYAFSVFNTLYPAFWENRGLHAHVYFEAAAVVIAFLLLGKLLEERAKSSTSAALKKLIGLQPQNVTIIHANGHHALVPIASVKSGDLLLAKPGEKIAVDGLVAEGSSFIDESTITGESLPVEKGTGDAVYAGTMNTNGSLSYRAVKVGSDTLLASIIRMVEEAQGSRAPVQKLVDRIAAVFVPVVIGIAIISLVAWLVLGGNNELSQGLLALVTVLIIACPCALGLATPTAIMAGIGKGAENGILIRDAESLETAMRMNAIVLDKTGTLTEGRPSVIHVRWKEGADQQKLLPLLVGIEQASAHPLAEAVVSHFKEVKPQAVQQFESVTGKGVKAVLNGEEYFVGNEALLKEIGVHIDEAFQSVMQEWLRSAFTVILFASSKEVLAIIAIADTLKPGSAEAVQQLEDAGIEVYMLTGDNSQTAAAIAGSTGIRSFQAGVLPEEKAAFIKKLQASGKVVGMVGDGVNDSTALALADVSIAMGKGNDIAKDVARMTIISSDLRKIVPATRLSKATVRIIRQNLFWAFIYNIIGIPVAAGILYPFTGYLLNPMIAGAAMALSSISVMLSSLRLKWLKL